MALPFAADACLLASSFEADADDADDAAELADDAAAIFEDSALVSVLGTMELMSRTKAIATSTTEYTAFYLAAAGLYFIITFAGVRALRALEARVRIPGYTPM